MESGSDTAYYRLAEIEITERLPAVKIGQSQRGYGILWRRKGVPVGFTLRKAKPGLVVTTEELQEQYTRDAGDDILRNAIQEGIVQRAPPPSGESRISLSVCVCTRDHPELLKRCVESVLRAHLPPASVLASLEVIVVDNAPSDDRTRLVVADCGDDRVTYCREDLPGLDFARNRAIAVASGEIVAFIDDDAVADSNWLVGLVNAWQFDPDAAAFTGLVTPLNFSTHAQVRFEERGGFRRGFKRARFGKVSLMNPYHPAGNEFGTGANMAFRRDAVLELGGFDEALDCGAPLPGGGDLDMFYRVVRAGKRLIYDPAIMVYHEHRATHKALRRQYYTWGLGLLAFVCKWQQCAEIEADESRRLHRLILAIFLYELKNLAKSLVGRSCLTPDLVLAEIYGGIVGLCGEYDRSRRRIVSVKERAC